MTPVLTPADVIEFWFDPNPQTLDQAMTLFQRIGPGLDDEIRQRFGDAIEEALAGGFAAWEDEPTSALGLVLLIDQMPRHAFRGTARQYAGDARAFAITQAGFERGWHEELPYLHAAMFLMPFAHVEDVAIHERNIAIQDALAARAPAALGPLAKIGPSQSRKYLEILRRFGRFPHRNALLGRENTPEEQAWLDAGGAESMPPDVEAIFAS